MGDHSPPSPDESTDCDGGEWSLDRDTIRTVLSDHPVTLAVLFGSQVSGRADAQSDVDIAVELTGPPREDPSQAVMELLSDLAIALDRDDVDLSLVSDLKPRVGVAAFTEGELLIGSSDRAEYHRQQFEQRVTEQSRDDLRRRFDTVLENVDASVGEHG